MKLNSHHIHARAADMGSVDTEGAGLSVTGSVMPEKSHLSNAVASAISFSHSSRFILPILSCAVPSLVFAGPEGGQVIAGSATISNPDANSTLITQSTSHAAIDWQRFNIGSQEYVQFAQPDASSVALNRVIGGDPSQILGNLSANGQVFLVNPNGVYFGQSATVDVGGIVASVNNIRIEDFMSGNYVFSKSADGPDDVGVVNDGVITARDGGYVVLMGDYVHNNGIIRARLGTVALAAGNQITMDVKGNGLVSVAVDEASLSDVAGVNNTGEIMAAGGRVMMTAKVANDLIDTAINNEGLVVAGGIAERNGVIFLTAVGGDIVNSGTLDASAEEGSGVNGGGVLVYSDKNVINASGAEIKAKGDSSGNGGVIRVIAEEQMDHQAGAKIDASSVDGDGGFVEVSGHKSLAIRGDVDIGTGGQLLIDPASLTIANSNNAPSFTTGGSSPSFSNGFVGKGFVEGQLNSNTNITLVAENNINAAAGTLGGSTFTLNATGLGDLTIINGRVTSSASGTLGNCSLTGVCLPGGSNGVLPSTSGNINLGKVSFNIAGGLNVAGGTGAGTVALGGINAGGNVSISAADSLLLSSNTVTAGGDVTIAGDIGSAGSLRTADLTINAGNDITIKSDIYLANNRLVLAADTDVDGVGDVNITGSTTDDLTIQTSAMMSVTGANFNVKGADFGTGSVSADTTGSLTAVTVQVSRLAANVSNQVIISGGRVNVVDSNNSTAGGRDVSVSVNATSDIDITATDLIVRGDSITANGTSFSTFITANGNAMLSAGNDININVSGDLTVAAGIANATASIYSSGSANALANAAINAGNNVNITNVGGTMTIKAGPASASMNSVVSGTGTAVAEANASISGSNITVGSAGSLNVNRGKASAIIQSFSSGNYSATASANASLVATQAVSLSVAGDINITGGTGASSNTASVTANSNGSPGNYVINANADAVIKGGTNVTVTTTSGGLTLAGGNATATAPTTAGAVYTNKATTNASLDGGGNVTINVGGAFNVSAGSASANAAGTDTATAEANARVIASAGDAVITAASVDLSAGIPIAGGTGNVTATEEVSLQGNNITLNVSGDMNAGSGTGASINAVNDISVFVGGVFDVNSNYFAGNNVALAAGNVLSLNNNFGSSASVKNYNLSLGGKTIFINNDIHLGNNTLTLSGQAGTGSIVIANTPGSDLDVKTGGQLSITGHDLLVKDTTTGSTGGSPSVGVEAANIDVVLSGDMDISAGSLTAIGSASGTFSVNASVTATNNMTITATNLNVNGGFADVTNTIGTNTQISANAKLGAGGNITLNVTDAINISAGTAVAGGQSGQTKTALADAEIVAGGNLTVNATNVNAVGGAASTVGSGTAIASAKTKLSATSEMSIVVNNNIIGNAADISAAGMYMAAGSNINLLTSNISVGNGTVAGVNGDAITLAFLATQGIPLPTTPNPNAKFSAGGTLDLGTITMDGNIPYLWMEADVTNIGGLVLPTASDVVVQYSPFTLTKTINVEDQPVTTNSYVNYNNLEHFSILPGTTIIIGSSLHTGEVLIGEVANVDIAAKNMVAVTASKVTSIDNVITTGIVAELILGQFDNEFVTPVLTEVEIGLLPVDDPEEDKEKKKNLVKDDEEDIKMCEAG